MLLGLDIGGTKIAGVLLDDSGQVCASTWTPHNARGAVAVADALSLAAADLAHTSLENVVIGVSISGLISQTGRVTTAALLELHDDDLGARISARLGCPTTLVNDADATLIAAAADDPDGPVTDAILLALGTGVGGAVLSGGRLIQGRVGYATELGHLPVVDPLDYPCVCGSSGCLEQLASGRGIQERARVLAGAGIADDLTAWVGRPAETLTSIDVVAAANAGVPSALGLIDDAGQAIGHALALLTVTFEPATIYLGGSLAHGAPDLLIPVIHKRLLRQVPFADVRLPPLIRLDHVGPNAAAVGAARLARTRLLPD